MTASPAQIEANRRNALKSTGPTTEEGKSRSRANSLKHGMTGAGVVLPVDQAAEVDRLAEAYRGELQVEGEIAAALARRMAVHKVRMDRAVAQEAAALSIQVRQAKQAFQRSFDRHADNARTLRDDATYRVLFDASPEAILARKYEAASERGFHAAYKELRRMRAEADRLARADATVEADAAVEADGAVEAESAPTPDPASPPAEVPAPAEELASFVPAPTAAVPVASEPVTTPAMHRAFALVSTALGFESERDIDGHVPITVGRAR